METKFVPLFDAEAIEDQVAHPSSWYNLDQFRTATFFLDATKTGTPGDLTVIVEVSPESPDDLNSDGVSGKVYMTYEKLIEAGGVDAPAASVVFSATGKDLVSLSMEDVIRAVRISATAAATTDETNKWDLSAWLGARA